jgi:hypothetical protein
MSSPSLIKWPTGVYADVTTHGINEHQGTYKDIKVSCILLGDLCALVVQSSLLFSRWSLVAQSTL